MFNNFEAWKLHSFSDYAYFFFMVALCIVFIVVGTKTISKGRTDKNALKRVSKRLKLKKNSGKVYNDVTLNLGKQALHYDHIIVDSAGIVLIRSIGWGIRIYGSAEDASWKVVDNKTDDKRIDNPVAALQSTFEALRGFLASNGIYNASIEPLTVFADPFARAELYLGRDSYCVEYEELKKWLKQRKLRAEAKTDKFDFNAAIKCLDSAIAANA